MTDGFLGIESALGLSQSKAEYVKHSVINGFRIPTPLCGNGDALYILKTHSSWVYLIDTHLTTSLLPDKTNQDKPFNQELLTN
jgi:hypothetical protein